MKSGRKIFRQVAGAECQAAAVHALGNGGLRSLIHYVTTSEKPAPEPGETLLALAMCEVTSRFMNKKSKLF